MLARACAFLVTSVLVATLGYAVVTTGRSHASARSDGADGGYAVRGVSYAIDVTSPSRLDAVSFELERDDGVLPAVVKVRLTGDDGAWYACLPSVVAGATRYRCATASPPVRVPEISELRVVSSE